MRINRFIAQSGFCSRRKADEYIQHGRVRVNGHVVVNLSLQVAENDEVEVDGEHIHLEPLRYYVYNKPRGYACSHEDYHAKRLIYEQLPTQYRLFSIGRLDVDSEGLLLVTNDGNFCMEYTHPRYGVEKEYYVFLPRPLQSAEKDALRRGICYRAEHYRFQRLERLTSPEMKEVQPWFEEFPMDSFGYRVCLNEGKKREIRRAFESLSLPVLRLCRIRMGAYRLENLFPGEYREVEKKCL